MASPCCSLTVLTTPPAVLWPLLLYMLQICGLSMMPNGSIQWFLSITALFRPIAVGHLPYPPLLQFDGACTKPEGCKQ